MLTWRARRPHGLLESRASKVHTCSTTKLCPRHTCNAQYAETTQSAAHAASGSDMVHQRSWGRQLEAVFVAPVCMVMLCCAVPRGFMRFRPADLEAQLDARQALLSALEAEKAAAQEATAAAAKSQADVQTHGAKLVSTASCPWLGVSLLQGLQECQWQHLQLCSCCTAWMHGCNLPEPAFRTMMLKLLLQAHGITTQHTSSSCTHTNQLHLACVLDASTALLAALCVCCYAGRHGGAAVCHAC